MDFTVTVHMLDDRWPRVFDTAPVIAAPTILKRICLKDAASGHPLEEGCRTAGIEWVGHEYPRRVGIDIDSGLDVGGEIRFGSSRAEGRAEDCAGNDSSPSNIKSRVGDLRTRCARPGPVE